MVFRVADSRERRQRAVLRLVEQERQPFIQQPEDVDIGLRCGPVVAVEEERVTEYRFGCVVDAESISTAVAYQVSGKVRNRTKEVFEERNGLDVVEGGLNRRR